MAEGIIKRLTNKGFGFIDTGKGKDLFFHSSSLNGVSFDALHEGQRCPTRKAGVRKVPAPRTLSRYKAERRLLLRESSVTFAA